MKTKIIYLTVFLAGILFWSCNKSATSTSPLVPAVSLKSALTQGVQNLTTAVNSISASTGYQVVTGPADLVTKSVELTPLDTQASQTGGEGGHAAGVRRGHQQFEGGRRSAGPLCG